MDVDAAVEQNEGVVDCSEERLFARVGHVGVGWRLDLLPGLGANAEFVKMVGGLAVGVAAKEVEFVPEESTDVGVDVEGGIEGIDGGPLLGGSVKHEQLLF